MGANVKEADWHNLIDLQVAADELRNALGELSAKMSAREAKVARMSARVRELAAIDDPTIPGMTDDQVEAVSRVLAAATR